MPQFHQILTGGPQYAPPVLRAPSPTCSIGTAYGDDATSLSDKDLDQDEFERKCEDRLRLNMPRPEEIEANIDPKLPRPKTATEEKVMFERVMNNLREQVQRLEENDLFEQAMFRSSQVAPQQQSSSDDIDTIMHSLMSSAFGPSAQIAGRPGLQGGVSRTPWSADLATEQYIAEGGTDSSVTTMGKRSDKGKTKGRGV
ncbi:hypothetical protein AcV5_007920 [Taiwanofungus camphoratus]|nr:hypothetical protein AcW2_007565 [Antrodia cinnamomea]KAI0927367.1 hypothetical protein AcV5_007920 [Antrodia cinnamomea]